VLDVEGPTASVKDPWGNVRAAVTATTKVNRQDFGVKWTPPWTTAVSSSVTMSISHRRGNDQASPGEIRQLTRLCQHGLGKEWAAQMHRPLLLNHQTELQAEGIELMQKPAPSDYPVTN